MPDQNPIQTAVRRRRRQERHGTPNPICVICGCTSLEALRQISGDTLKHWLTAVPANVIELHHVVGVQHDPDLVVPVCMNCHRTLTEALEQAGVNMRPACDTQSLIAGVLEALAVFFEFLVKTLRRMAALLRNTPTLEHAK